MTLLLLRIGRELPVKASPGEPGSVSIRVSCYKAVREEGKPVCKDGCFLKPGLYAGELGHPDGTVRSAHALTKSE